MYFGKKKLQKSPDVKNINTFLFDKTTCNINKNKYSYLDLLKSAFKDVFPKTT
jgi:hypothetical protein